MQKSLTIKLGDAGQQRVKRGLEEFGWVQELDRNRHVSWRLSCDGGVAVQYHSGKLVVQARAHVFEEIGGLLGVQEVGGSVLQELGSDKFVRMVSDTEYIGCDEAGKGEFFGPLVLCACYVPKKASLQLKKAGVVDSKMLSDTQVLLLAPKVRAVSQYKLVALKPLELTRRWKSVRNLSQIMATSFSDAIVSLLSGVVGEDGVGSTIDWIVMDRFTSKSNRLEKAISSKTVSQKSVLGLVQLKQIENGERCLNVAAASILARAEYLEFMSELKVKYGREFVRGYGVKLKGFCKQFIKEFGLDEFDKVAKGFFKTYKEVIG